MSSKSRKHSSPTKRKTRPEAEGQEPGGEHDSVKVAGVELGDDVVIVPRDRNPMFFLLMIALLIFLLIIFIVPGAMIAAVGGGGGGGTEEGIADYLSYQLPIDGQLVTEEMDQGTFIDRRMQIDKVVEMDPFLLLPLGIIPGRGGDLEEEDHARLVFLDRLAEVSGVYVPREDLIEHLKTVVTRSFQGNLEAYKQYFAASRDRVSSQEFEEELARVLRARRFVTMLSEIPRVADPGWIEETWANERKDRRFEYATLAVEDVAEEVRTEGIEDEALQAWFDEREEFQRQAYLTDERRTVSFAVVRDFDAFDPTALLAKYPTAEGTDPDEQAEDYYSRVFLDRFRFDPEENVQGPDLPGTEGDETGEEGESSEGDAAPQEDPVEDDQIKEYLEYEEVAEAAKREAPIYFALQDWSDSLQDRTFAGEEIDFAAEAAELGIEVLTTDSLTSDELVAFDGFDTEPIANDVRITSEGNVGSQLIGTEDAIGVFHVDAVEAPEIPPVTEIREEVFEEWVEETAEARALERLNAIRDAFEEFEPEEDEDEAFPRQPLTDADGEEVPYRRADSEAFRAACEAAGLTVAVRDWFDRRGPTVADPDATEPAHLYLRGNREGVDAEEGEVLQPGLTTGRDLAILARKDGEREVPLERMSPNDYTTYKARSENSAAGQFRNSLDFASLEERFGLKLYDSRSDEERARDEAREAGEDAPAE